MSSLGIGAELARLEERIAALEQRQQTQQPPSEAASANYLTVNAQGQVGALFSGGVQMIESTTSGYVASASLAWLDDTDKTTPREFIKGRHSGGGQHQLILSELPDATDSAQINLAATVNGALGSAFALLQCVDNAGGAASVSMLDSLGRSGFLQLIHNAQLAVDAGAGTVHFANSAQSNAVTVTHGLGRAPVVAGAWADQGNGVFFTTTNRDATDFEIQGAFGLVSVLGNLNQDVAFTWLAIG